MKILEELKRQQETYADKIKEKAEETDQTDTPEESDGVADEIRTTAENAKKILEEAYDLEDDKKVKTEEKDEKKDKAYRSADIKYFCRLSGTPGKSKGYVPYRKG